MIVVDNDVISYFWLEISDRSPVARRARARDSDWAVPYLWRSEFRNVLRHYIRLDVIGYAEALWYARKAEADLRGNEHPVATAAVLKLVEQTGHSAYDCEYVALAQQLNVKLVTGDRDVARLFPNTAVLLEDFVSAT